MSALSKIADDLGRIAIEANEHGELVEPFELRIIARRLIELSHMIEESLHATTAE